MIDYDENVLNSALYTREYFLQEDICRLCWSKDAGNELFSRKVICTIKSTLFFKVQSCLDIDLSEDDSEYHPRKICEKCFLKIEQIHDFKVFCQKSNQKLKKILNGSDCSETKFKTESIILEDPVKIEKDEGNIIGIIDIIGAESLSSFSDGFQTFETDVVNVKETVKKSNTKKNITQPLNIPSLKKQPANKSKQKVVKPSQIPNSPPPKYKLRNVSIISTNVTTLTKKSRRKLNKETSNTLKRKPYERPSTYCNTCYIDLKDNEAYLNHKSEVHGIERDGRFRCFGCGKLFNNRKTRLRHEGYSCKSLEYGFKCNICGRYLPRRGSYEKHLNYHRLNKIKDQPEDLGGIYKCVKCNERFTKRSEWYKHKLKEHRLKIDYVCETCGKVFSRQDYLTKHIFIHTGEKPYKCSLCSYQAAQPTNMTIHMRKHTNDRPYACDLCPQRCVSISNLHAHRRRHLGLKKFQCSICNKTFGYKQSLNEHISIKHQQSQANTCQKFVGRIAPLGGGENQVLNLNRGVPLQYRVDFPVTSPLPKVTSVTVNGNMLCYGPGDVPSPFQYVTMTSLQHTLFLKSVSPGIQQIEPQPEAMPELDFDFFNQLPNDGQTQIFTLDENGLHQQGTWNPISHPNMQESKPPATQPPRKTSPPPPPQYFPEVITQPPPLPQPVQTPAPPPPPLMPIPQPQAAPSSGECGIVAGGNERQPLIFNGQSFSRGDWPWLVAIYKRKDGSLSFICSGTLVSDRHVVTAAHCMQSKNSFSSNKDIVVKVGVYNLEDWGDDVTVTRTLTSASLHDDYNATSLANDILVLTFERSVTFNTYIRAACLWAGNADLTRIVGASGVVAGWGQSERGSAGRGEPRAVRLPVVSTAVCRASRPDFHKLTSASTLCAGDRNGAGPCLGDSGGGLYLLEGGRWRLRGVVSLSLRPDSGDATCNLDEYIVFTDSAQYIDWIQTVMHSY